MDGKQHAGDEMTDLIHYLRNRLLITIGLIETALTAACIDQLLSHPDDRVLVSGLLASSLLIALALLLRLRSGRARRLRLVALTFLMLLPGYDDVVDDVDVTLHAGRDHGAAAHGGEGRRVEPLGTSTTPFTRLEVSR